MELRELIKGTHIQKHMHIYDRIIVGVSFFTCIGLLASAQARSGSVVVASTSFNEIVIAGDSRETERNGEQTDVCKIELLGQNLAYANTGTTKYVNAKLSWDAMEIARNTYARLKPVHSSEPIQFRMARAWKAEVQKKLQADIIRDKADTLWAQNPNEPIAAAIFAGFDGSVPLIVETSVMYTESPTGIARAEPGQEKAYQDPGRLVAIGKPELAMEFTRQKTTRAREEWAKRLGQENPEDADRLASFAIEAVRFSIKYSPTEIVAGRNVSMLGGPVDAVRLSIIGGTDWIQRKQKCRAD